MNDLPPKTAAAHRLLDRIASEFAPAVLASSLGAEDMVLTDLIFANGLPIDVFTLDTGRLPSETTSSRIDELSDGRLICVTRHPTEGGGWVASHQDISARLLAEKHLKQTTAL